MKHAPLATRTTVALPALACALALVAPAWAGPFATGATAAQTNILTILTPIAVVAVMVLGVAAWFNRIAWGWVVALKQLGRSAARRGKQEHRREQARWYS